MSNEQKTIFICALPGIGHLNPILSVSSELIKRKHRVIVFCDDVFQKIIKKSGAEYRPYYLKFAPNKSHFDVDDTQGMLMFFLQLIKVAHEDVDYMLNQVITEHPDLIIYDQFSFTTKYLLKLMTKNFEDKISAFKAPKSICFYTCFAMKPSIYPDKDQSKRLLVADYWSNSLSFSVFNEQVKLCHKYKIEAENPFELAYNFTANLNIVSCFQELQPKSQEFDSSFNFVGCCLSNETHNFEINDKQLDEILTSFEIINPNNEIKQSSKKLIYASLGTLFNYKVDVFEKILESTNILNESINLTLLVSCGKLTMNYLQEKIKNGYFIPKNVILVEFAPQVEILKRASLFITHAGMNSCSEAIHFGVPVICLPLKADQPLCAIRLADDLKLGARLDSNKFSSQELSDAVSLILNDMSFTERAVNFSKISRKYQGTLEACRIIENYMLD
uniref:UDP-glucuronosyltransferase n=1 Tax=Brachionus koreanus TaxID=1199090 RepID=A0A7H9SQJ5_9BILA|nr:UDP-glucuronosyltransferase-like protein 4 [Brachionus koreanus]